MSQMGIVVGSAGGGGGTGNFNWVNITANNFVAQNEFGYFWTTVGESGTMTLPPVANTGDQVRLVLISTSRLDVTANTGQQIQIGTNSTAAQTINTITSQPPNGGNCQGMTLNLIYDANNSTWYQLQAPITNGSWYFASPV